MESYDRLNSAESRAQCLHDVKRDIGAAKASFRSSEQLDARWLDKGCDFWEG